MGKKIKVLHVLGGLNRGGVETWLMHVLRHIDRDKFQLDFLVSTTRECAYDHEAQALGSRIIHNPDPHSPLLYARNFVRNYKKYGPYDIVHSHVHHFSGFVLFLSKIVGVPMRISHSHNDTRSAEASKGLSRKMYLRLMKWLIDICSTHGLAASAMAAEDLFGMDWRKDKRWSVLHYGINLEPFNRNVDRVKIRRELGIHDNAFVVGHVGRFAEQKNHAFLLDIAASVLEREQDIIFLLVGDGPLRPLMGKRAEDLDIKDKVIFTGVRSDIPDLMLGAMDLFLFPSLYEGLPVTLIEAQAAGITCLISDVITEEVDIIKEIVYRISLEEAPFVWAEKVVELRGKKESYSKERCLQIISNSPFNIKNSVSKLCSLYHYGNVSEQE